MQTNKGDTFSIVLITLGACILLSKIGIHLSSYLSYGLSYLFPLILVVLGYYGVRAGNSFFGWTLIIVGMMGFTSQLSKIIGIIVAVAMIGFGVSTLSGNRHKGHPD